MLNSLLEDVRTAAWNVAKLGLATALISWLAAVGMFFLTLAAFIWAEVEFGALAAAAGLGAFFLALSLALAAVIWFLRRYGSSQLEPQAPQKAQYDRAAAAAVEALQFLGPKSVFPALAMSMVILAATQGGARSNTRAGTAK